MAEAEMEMKLSPEDGWGRHGRNLFDYDGFESVCCDRPVGKETFTIQQRVSRLEAENSLLRSEMDSEKKMIEVYKDLNKKISENEDRDNKRWTEQLVHNATQDARLAVLEREVHQLYSMCGLYVEASHVTPRPMERFNSWDIPVVATGTAPAQA